MKKRTYHLATTLALWCAVVLLTAGCSGSSQSTETMNYYNSAPAMMEDQMKMEAESATGSALTSGTAMQPIPSERKLIRNANLSVEATDFDALLDNITQTVTTLGGYTEQSDISGNSVSASGQERRYAYLTVRIPSSKLDQFIQQVGEQGNITNKSESTQDVTLQYSDIESRKKSLTIEQERLWDLLEKADTLEAVIALESRLSEIRYQLESFESQLRTYDNQVDYSTVSLNIREVQVFTPTTPDSIATRIQKGFSKNLAAVGSGLINFFIWFLSSIPSLLLIGVIIAIPYLIFKKIVKKTIAKKAKKTPPVTKESD